MRTLPFVLPSAYKLNAGVSTVPADIDVGGYDFMIGGHGFRLATDTQFAYQRATEATTVHRFDSSLEPGEQSLASLPWIKAQSSFHAGAGQLNLEQGFTSFQYQQEQVEHIRFDTCLGIDCWTPGKTVRLPDTWFFSFGFASTAMVTATLGGKDYAVVGGLHSLYQLKWNSGPDAAPTASAIDLTPVLYGGAANVTVASLTTDGLNYYALLQLTADGSVAGVRTYVVKGSIDSTVAPTAIYASGATGTQVPGVLGWVKARLVGGLGNSFYELPTSPAGPPAAFPTAKYTHPATTFNWAAISESPDAILAAGTSGQQSQVLSFTLDSAGAVPTLSGGNTVAVMPAGEIIYSLGSLLGSFMSIGTSQGIRVGTFDTYTGALKWGPLSVTTTAPVLSMTGRDRFVYAGYTNQQADGKTGLCRIDLSMVVDAAGRLAYAPDLRPPTTAPTGLGSVTGVGLLPLANRVVFITPEGVHVEGSGPGSDGDAWLRTSRIRYDTAELKLFKLGRLHGALDVASIQVTGIIPFGADTNLGTFGFIASGDPGEFRLPGGLNEWIQLKFDLAGSACVFNGYQTKALPAPRRQHLITLTANCFRNETDRFGLDVTDPETPRQRLQNVIDIEANGDEVRFVEFTNSGAVAQLVVIDQLAYQSFSRPNIEDDFGGYITLKLRSTES